MMHGGCGGMIACNMLEPESIQAMAADTELGQWTGDLLNRLAI